MRIPVRSAVLYTVTSVDGRPSPSRAGSQNVYPGGIEVPKLGCVSSHGYPSTPAICPLQTRLARNGHVATYFAACGQCRASHSWSPKMGSNSGPRLFAIIVSPLQVLTSIRRLSTRSRAYGCKPSTRRVADSQELNSLPRRLTCPSRLSISCNAPGLRHRGTYWKPAGVSTASCAGLSALRHGIFVSTTPPDPPVSSAFSYCSRLTDSSPIKLQHPVVQVRRSSAIGSSFSTGPIELRRVVIRHLITQNALRLRSRRHDHSRPGAARTSHPLTRRSIFYLSSTVAFLAALCGSRRILLYHSQPLNGLHGTMMRPNMRRGNRRCSILMTTVTRWIFVKIGDFQSGCYSVA